MGKKDPRVDAYIAKAPDFAKPILEEIRARVHAACPGVQEALKWSVPAFDYKGPMCGMAAFKKHCMFGFWKSPLVIGESKPGDNPMGFREKLTSVKDLPSKSEFRANVKKAMELNDRGIKVPRPARGPKAEIPVPDDFAAAIEKNKKAQATFDKFSPSHRREYLEWITEAKTDATRARRLVQAIEWMAEGKPRNWKYM
jgi:uncharacterized protein YdeI (YjbR/CyaY-like superfamily)